jgi:hypothetical protein
MLFIGRNRKHAGKKSAAFQMLCSRRTIVGNFATHFEAAGDFLRMVTFNAAAEWKIGRASENEIEVFVVAQNFFIAEIALPNFITIFESVPARRFFCEVNAFFLRFDRDKFCAGQSPRGNHSNGSNSATQIENGSSRRTPTCSIPRGQNVVG